MVQKSEKIRCNNCYTIFESEEDLPTLTDFGGEPGCDVIYYKGCGKCKTDAYLMQPFEE